jgi:hypothetical protein
MSEYEQFLKERDQIEALIQKGYRLKRVTETWNGDLVEFERTGNPKLENLLLTTPNARKYFTVKLLKQKK